MSQTSLNMGLIEWPADTDQFNATQLATNFSLLDQHDHTPGKGVQIGSAAIQLGAIVSDLIATGAVTSNALATNAVTTSKIADGAVTGPKIAAGSITGSDIAEGTITEDKLDPNILPLGTVALWWRHPGVNTLPGGGWEIMDGRSWSGISNNLGLSTGRIPDMRGAFPMGADPHAVVAPGINAKGGGNGVDLSHAHSVNYHAHGIPDHAHTIGFDGMHSHSIGGGYQLALRPNSFVSGIQVEDTSGTSRNNKYGSFHPWQWPLDSLSNQDVILPIDNAGGHTHGGWTGIDSLATELANAGTDSQLGTVDVTPQYVALLFIMLVR